MTTRPIAPVLAPALALSMAVTLPACAPGAPGTSDGSLSVQLQAVDTVQLQDALGDTLGQVGSVRALADGRLLVADGILSRVRLHAPDGTLLGGQGRQGEGPFEYQAIASVGTDAAGNILVVSAQPPRTTVLTAALEPDTVHLHPQGILYLFGAEPFAGGAVHVAISPDSAHLILRTAEGRVEWRHPAGPRDLFEKPYWRSYAGFHLAAVGGRLLVANSLLYPIHIHDSSGRRIAEIGTAPPSFSPIPEVQPGAFAFTDISEAPTVMARVGEWVASFTRITGIHVVADRWLVVGHGRHSTDTPGPPFPLVETDFDVYDLESGAKVLEEIPLEEGARIVSGGTHLHVLVSEPPEPWAIVRWRVGEEGAVAQEFGASACLEEPQRYPILGLAGVVGIVRLNSQQLALRQAGVHHPSVVTLDAGTAGPLGGEGDGPGEYRSVSAMGLFNGALWVSDARTGRVTQYDPGLRAVTTLPLQLPHVPRPFLPGSVRYLSDGSRLHVPRFIPDGHASHGSDLPGLPIRRFGGEGPRWYGFNLHTGPLFGTVSRGGTAVTYPLPLTSGLLFDTSPDGSMVGWAELDNSQATLTIRLYEVEADTTHEQRTRWSAVPVPRPEREAALAEIRSVVGSLGRGAERDIGDRVPREYPLVDRLVVSDLGEVWMRRPGTAGAGWVVALPSRGSWMSWDPLGAPGLDLLLASRDELIGVVEGPTGSEIVRYGRC